MNKVYGKKTDFAPIREDASRVIVSYDLEEVDAENATWFEVYLYKKQVSMISIGTVREAVINDINQRTEAKIINGYEFTPDGSEEAITVWLSEESQHNFGEAHRLQIVPVKFKLNEDEQTKQAIYHTFVTFEELDRFYKGGMQYINQCLNEGWQRKDSIDWSVYEEVLNSVVETEEESSGNTEGTEAE